MNSSAVFSPGGARSRAAAAGPQGGGETFAPSSGRSALTRARSRVVVQRKLCHEFLQKARLHFLEGDLNQAGDRGKEASHHAPGLESRSRMLPAAPQRCRGQSSNIWPTTGLSMGNQFTSTRGVQLFQDSAGSAGGFYDVF